MDRSVFVAPEIREVIFDASVATSPHFPTLTGKPPYVIAHRGSAALHPEHTLEAYSLAAHLGADLLEPDLVLTKDGILVCRHDIILGETTDVGKHPEFADRRRNITIPFLSATATWANEWAIGDFTLEELRTLNAVQREVGRRSPIYDGLFHIPTFEEFLQQYAMLAEQFAGQLKGVVPELKHPAYHNGIHGESYMEKALLRILEANPVPSDHEVIIQCFYPEPLAYLREHSEYTTLLLAHAFTWTHATVRGLGEIGGLATVFGPWYGLLHGRGAEGWLEVMGKSPAAEELAEWGGWADPESILPSLHAKGVKVMPFTAAAVGETGGVSEKDMMGWALSGIDGYFSDDVAVGVRGRSLAGLALSLSRSHE